MWVQASSGAGSFLWDTPGATCGGVRGQSVPKYLPAHGEQRQLGILSTIGERQKGLFETAG